MPALKTIRKTVFPAALALFILLAFGALALTQAHAQAPAPAVTIGGLNTLLAQLDQVAQTTNLDLAKLRIEKWKTNGDARQQLQSNADLLSRNLSGTLPGLTAALRSRPDDLAASFKLYRNVDALYDVLSALTDTASGAAPRNDYESLAADASNLQTIRHGLADRIEALAAMKDNELARLRGGGTSSSSAKTAKSGSGVKKIVIDDTASSRSTTRKKKTVPPQ